MRNIILSSIFFLLSLPAFAQEPFITTWETTAADESITIPTHPAYSYNYAVDWGDGVVESGFAGDANHTYTAAGTYMVSVTGVFPAIYFNNGGDKDKIKVLEQWGDIAWREMYFSFYGCSELTSTATDVPILTEVTYMSGMFRDAKAFNGDLSNWDVSSVSDMTEMFQNAAAFNGDLSNWVVSSVTNMNMMFSGADAFNSDLNDWDVSSVTNMEFMFSSADVFNGNLSDWDVSLVTNMGGMFINASQFNRDLSDWDVSSATNMGAMFFGASQFKSDLSGWDVSSVTSMGGMFFGASQFNSDLSDWDVSLTTNMSSMFNSASAFTSDLSSWDVSSVTNMEFMLSGANAFTSDLSSWDVSSVVYINGMFKSATSFNSDLSSWDVSSVTDMAEIFDLSGMLTENYDKTLIGWSTLSEGETKIPTNITLGAQGINYCVSDAQRADLVNTYGWVINDSGQSCPPVPDAETLSDLTGDCSIDEPTAPTATDLIDGTIIGITDAIFPLTTGDEIIWVFTNSAGKSSEQVQKVVFMDITPPVPDILTLPNVTSDKEVAELVAPTALDNCSGVSIGISDVFLPISAEGTTLVTWVYSDNSGNQSTQTQKVVITFVTGLDNRKQDLSIYPNPVTKGFGLSGMAIDELAILDINGKVIQWYKTPQLSYDISHLRSGIYTVVVWSDSKRQFLRLVKE